MPQHGPFPLILAGGERIQGTTKASGNASGMHHLPEHHAYDGMVV
jgi:hypothetical protein